MVAVFGGEGGGPPAGGLAGEVGEGLGEGDGLGEADGLGEGLGEGLGDGGGAARAVTVTPSTSMRVRLMTAIAPVANVESLTAAIFISRSARYRPSL